ncbi:MAG TPA: hypothetical protein VMU84_20700 [Thermoanaerobaculia bacterium]|nr:hypothetical protein [Thermoanaerobaculia bacterium]
MKKTSPAVDDDPLDHEIDFSNARRNPFARDFYKSKNLRVLDPDLLEIFPDSDSVNDVLHMIVRAAQAKQSAPPQKISARRATAPKSKKRKAS